MKTMSKKLNKLDIFQEEVQRFMASVNKSYVEPPPAQTVGLRVIKNPIGGIFVKEEELEQPTSGTLKIFNSKTEENQHLTNFLWCRHFSSNKRNYDSPMASIKDVFRMGYIFQPQKFDLYIDNKSDKGSELEGFVGDDHLDHGGVNAWGNNRGDSGRQRGGRNFAP